MHSKKASFVSNASQTRRKYSSITFSLDIHAHNLPCFHSGYPDTSPAEPSASRPEVASASIAALHADSVIDDPSIAARNLGNVPWG